MIKVLSSEVFTFLFPNHCVVLFCRYQKIHDYIVVILSNPVFVQYKITVHTENLIHLKKTHFANISSREKLVRCYRTNKQSVAFLLLTGARFATS